FTRTGLNLSNNPAANNYAPTLFAREGEAKSKQLSKTGLEAAMRRLFAAEQLAVEPYGPPSRNFPRIIRKAGPEPGSNGYRILVECSPDTNCVHCGKGQNVRRISAVGKPGVKSETLHEECAPAWFAAV